MATACVDLASIPSARVGWLLAHARERAGFTRTEVAAAIEAEPRMVREWEEGRLVPSLAQAQSIADLFGLTLPELFPPREPIVLDLDRGTLRMRDTEVNLNTEAGNQAVLRTYMELVWVHRGLDPGSRVKLRDDDIDVLSRVLDLDADSLESELVGIMGVTKREAGRLRRQLWKRRLLIGAAGVVVAGMAAVPAARALSGGDGPASTDPTVASVDERVPGGDWADIGEGIQVTNPNAP